MFCPHLFEFRQLFCSSATNHVMFEVKLFSVVPQKAIPQHPCAIWIRLLLIPKVFLRNKTTAHNINIFQFPFVWAYMKDQQCYLWMKQECMIRSPQVSLQVITQLSGNSCLPVCHQARLCGLFTLFQMFFGGSHYRDNEIFPRSRVNHASIMKAIRRFLWRARRQKPIFQSVSDPWLMGFEQTLSETTQTNLASVKYEPGVWPSFPQVSP